LRPRCLDKLFNEVEINYIQSHQNSILAFWHLWSVKETAYKAWQRQFNTEPIFNPKSFKCINIALVKTKVLKDDFTYSVKTRHTNVYIYSEIISKGLKSKIFFSQKNYDIYLSSLIKKGLKIQKNKKRIPYLKFKTHHLPISISHNNGLSALVVQKDILKK